MDTVRLHATLHLILTALEVVNNCLDATFSSKISGQRHRSSLGLLKIATDCLEKILRNFKTSVDLEVIAEQIWHLAQALDDHLAGKEDQDGGEVLNPSFNYPTLRAVINASKARISHQNGGFLSILKSPKRCSSLEKVMASIYDELVEAQPHTEDEDSCLEISAPYDGGCHGVADRLFGAISCRCDPKSTQEMRLRLGTFRTKELDVNGRTFDVLLLGCDQGNLFWHSLRIHTPTVCQEPDAEPGFWREDSPISRHCLCSCVEELKSFWKIYTRHLEVDDQSMLQEHTCLKDPEDFPNEEFSLPTLLLAISRTETGKVVLGMQLAHALTYLYDGGWLTGRWQERNFSLFGRGGKVPCKPWLKVSLPQQPRPQTIKQPRFHRFPQILELGIILLELQIGEGLESSLGEQPTEDLDQRWAMATTKFMMMEKHILSDDYRRALAFCLKPGASLSAEAVKQPELVRQAIHDNVVVPLESAITRSKIGHDIFESLDLRDTMSSSPPSTLDQLLPQEGTRPSPSEDIRHQTTTTPASQVVQPDEKNTATEIEKDFELFGSEQELQPNQEQSRVSDDWIKGFKQIVKDKLKGEKARQNELRVKIAVLDTGIDLKHMDFRGEYKDGRIKSVRSWVDGADGMEDSEAGDSSGHGTFIASLLLDLGPPIDLYVARVSKSKNFKQGTSENIANALHYARTEWKVDIITMSFGYPCGVARIKSEITQAVQSNILVFAAASNDGGNRSRMFPARQLLVFAIHSTSGHGNMSNFNPDPKRDENFSILGEYIEAAWLTTGGSASTRRLSGTSFATPIAACLAAFMLVYVPCILPEYQNLHHCLKSYEGMRNVLQLMANERTTAGGLAYQYLSPQLYFGENTLAGITASIEKALSF